MPENTSPFDPYAILAALERRRVSYVVIGGLARVIHGTDEITHDVDIAPSLRPKNLERLEEALALLEARPNHRAITDLGTATGDTGVVGFDTKSGRIDLAPRPKGTRNGYDDLRRAATREPIGKGLRPPVASAADLARMLAALGREADRPKLLQLRRLIELERGQRLAVEL
jgi:hypothetical protein